MQVLITSSRMPYAVTEIRAFSRCGHTVHAADTFSTAPGSHSSAVTRAHETVSPRKDPAGYAHQIGMLVDKFAIDLVLPTFEEVFYLSKFGNTAGNHGAPIFCAPFEVLSMLHNKAAFLDFARTLGLAVPPTEVCTSSAQLRRALDRFDPYFARAVYSRAGVGLLTNTGPLAGDVEVDQVEPTPEAPWIVQGYLEGTDVCSFSIARHGRVVAHSTYVHPKTLDDAGGIVFESIVDPQSLEVAQAIVSALDYHGQISLDLMRADDGTLYLVECNPRPTSGVCVMRPQTVVDAITGTLDGRPPVVSPAGVRRSIRSALIRDMIVNPSEALDDLKEIFSDTPDVYFDEDDQGPGFYQFLSLGHVLDHWRSGKGSPDDKLAAGYLHDVCWDGEPFDGPEATARGPRSIAV